MKILSFVNIKNPLCSRKIFNRIPGAAMMTVTGIALIITLTSTMLHAQDDSLSPSLQPSPEIDSTVTESAPQAVPDSSAAASGEILEETAAPPEDYAVPSTARLKNTDLVNILLKNKKARANGWGEYVVGGHCLCCDNMKSIDCVSVKTRNRTDKLKVKQVIDGKVPRDTSDDKTFFGNVFERENPTRPVAILMADITWPKMQDIHKVIVYTVPDSLKPKNVPFNCELGYYDQFDRLRWLKKVENCGHDEQIVFDLEKPVLTKNILLKIKDGRSKLTEVSVFGEASAE